MHRIISRDQLYVTVDLLIMTVEDGKLELLLSRRGMAPYEGCWALPGRFVGLDESAEGAAESLMAEMLPVKGAFLEQLYTFTEVNRDPRGRVISAAYLAIVPWLRLEETLSRQDTPFRLFTPGWRDGLLRLNGRNGEILTAGDLAFDHGRIIETGLVRLQGKIDYTDIGFRFLNDPSAFSLSELQTVFEAVLGKEQDSSNFRRFILKRYEGSGRMAQTEQAETNRRGRPAALYRFSFGKQGVSP